MTKGSRRHPASLRCISLLSAGLLAAMAFDSVAALAGVCAETVRDVSGTKFTGFAAHTVIRNTSKSGKYDVVLSIDDKALEKHETRSATLEPNGGELKKLRQISGMSTWDFRVSLAPTGASGDEPTVCNYQVHLRELSTRWNPGTSSTDSNLCNGGLEVSCSKSFHKGKARWNTVFEIGD